MQYWCMVAISSKEVVRQRTSAFTLHTKRLGYSVWKVFDEASKSSVWLV